jgi:hypothetical protein
MRFFSLSRLAHHTRLALFLHINKSLLFCRRAGCRRRHSGEYETHKIYILHIPFLRATPSHRRRFVSIRVYTHERWKKQRNNSSALFISFARNAIKINYIANTVGVCAT